MERSKRKTDFLTEPGFFSLAVLVEIIRQTEDKGAAVPLSTVARKLGMSLSYAEKLAVILRREGLVKTVRGVRGGFAPAKAPQDIPAAAVVRAAYGHSILRESGTDSMRKVQKLRAHLHNLNYLYLDKITVADIIADQLDQNPHVGLLTAILREAPREAAADAGTGVVEQYWPPISMGTIRSGAGHSYVFHRAEWLDTQVEPATGQSVSFQPDLLQATRIRPRD